MFCLNTNSPEYKELQSVSGLKEALLTAKIKAWQTENRTSLFPSPKDLFGPAYQNTLGTVEEISSEVSLARAEELAYKFSERLGVPLRQVSVEEASNILGDTFNYQKGFLKDGTAYIVGSFDLDTAVHELGHPIIEALYQKNKTVFDTLYSQLETTPEGARIIQMVAEEYKEYSVENQKKEALVYAFESAGKSALEDNDHKNFIKELFYQVRKLMRSLFGIKADVSKLTSSTSLRDLADMLVKGDLELYVEEITPQEEVNFKKVVLKLSSEFEKIDTATAIGVGPKSTITKIDQAEIIQNNLRLIENQLDILRGSTDQELLDWFTEDGSNSNANLLKNISTTLKTVDAAYLKELQENIEFVSLEVSGIKAVIQGIEYVRDMSDNIIQETATMTDLNEEAIGRLMTFRNFISAYGDFINDLSHIAENGGNNNSSFKLLVQEALTKIQSAESKIDKVVLKEVGEILFNEVEPANSRLEQKYLERIAKLEKDGAPELTIEREYKEWFGLSKKEHKELESLMATPSLGQKQRERLVELQKLAWTRGLRMSKERLISNLTGELGDAHNMNTLMENFSMNQDPTLNSFGEYLRRHYSQVQSIAYLKFSKFRDEVQPLIEAAGYSKFTPEKVGQELSYLEDVGVYNPETESIDTYQVPRFLNPFTGHEKKRSELELSRSKAIKKYEETRSDDDFEKVIDAEIALNEFNFKYMHSRLTAEANAVREPLTRDRLGYTASLKYELLLNNLQQLSSHAYSSEEERLENLQKRRNAERLLKNLQSPIDLNGNPKTGEDLEIALRLQEYSQKIRDLDQPLKIYTPNTQKFLNALKKYETEIKDDPEFESKRKEWIKNNTKVSLSDMDRATINETNRKIDSLYSTLLSIIADKQSIDNKSEIERLSAERASLMKAYRRENSQIEGSLMPQNIRIRIKDIDEKLEELKLNTIGKSGLSPREQKILNMKNNSAYYQEAQNIKAKLAGYGPEANSIIAEIKALQKELSAYDRDVSEDYLDELQNIIDNSGSILEKDFLNKALEWNQANTLQETLTELTPRLLQAYLGSIEATGLFQEYVDNSEGQFEFTNLYKFISDNHYLKEGVLTPSIAWTIYSPSTPVKFSFTNYKGEQEETNLPINIYSDVETNPYYLTEKVVGKTVDIKGRWLPRLDVENSPFINKAYFDLKRESPAKFTLLEKVVEYHTSNQEGLDKTQQLGLDLPRYQMDFDENVRSGKKIERWTQGVRRFFRRNETDYQEGAGNLEQVVEDGFTETHIDIFDADSRKVVVTGHARLEESLVSRNIFSTLERYMVETVKADVLNKIHPVAQAVANIVENSEIKDPLVLDKKKRQRGKLVFKNKSTEGEQSVREKAINAQVSRLFYGEKLAGVGKDWVVAQKALNKLMGAASFQFFALNINSAIKQQLGQKFQASIEAASGEYFNHKDLILAEGKTSSTMAKITANVRSNKSQPLDVMLAMLFDAEPGKSLDKIQTAGTRNALKDTINGEFFMAPREWLQYQASLQVYYAYMSKITVDQVQKDGSVKKIPYLDAFEKQNSRVVLKEGIDPEYGFIYDADGNVLREGKNFSETKKKLIQIQYKLNGIYDELGQPLADRYLMMRYMAGFRKYFTSALMYRFGFRGGLKALKKGEFQPRINAMSGEAEVGFYIQNLMTIMDGFKTKGKSFKHLSKREKEALKRSAAEAIKLLTISLILIPLLGYDDDDPERFNKLRENSGPLPMFFVSDDNPEFKMGGWLQNQALLMLMNVEDENNSFNPLLGGAKDLIEIGKLNPIVISPTLDSYSKLLGHLAQYLGNATGIYENTNWEYKRNVGAYEWEKQGSSKFVKDFMDLIGFNGNTVDPATATRNLVQNQRR